MNNALSLPPSDDLDTSMRMVARNLAMGIYEIDVILKNCDVKITDFNRWRNHPRFLEYLKSEKDAWTAAQNTPERAKLKAGIIMEEFMVDAFTELRDKKTPLNQRVELAKLLAKIAGMGEREAVPTGGGAGGGFNLQINIGAGLQPVTINHSIPAQTQALEYSEYNSRDLSFDTGADDYDPFTSPQTLDDE
jgi:hypothetical protein